MEAGRKLDALVAEKVLRLTVVRTDDYDAVADSSGTFSGFVAAYSTDIAAAESVAIALRDRGFIVQTEWHPRSRGFARVSRKGEPLVGQPTQKWDSEGESVSHAICLAALAAVGAKVPA